MAVFHAAAKLVEVLTSEKPKSRRRRRQDKEQRIQQTIETHVRCEELGRKGGATGGVINVGFESWEAKCREDHAQ
jgi:membrane protein implicated in regulation of membrane protease activity